jgi:hypothetical protein
LNQKLIDYLTSRENLRNSLNNKFSHAATYEDFIRLIKSSNNIEELKQLHYKIMNEMMQATIINEFKYGKSSDSGGANVSPNSSSSLNSGVVTLGSSSFFASFSATNTNEAIENVYLNAPNTIGKTLNSTDKNTKADLLRSRNLKIYIKQLRFAKLLCERRISRLNSNSTGSMSSKSKHQSTFYDEEANDFENKLKQRKVQDFLRKYYNVD